MTGPGGWSRPPSRRAGLTPTSSVFARCARDAAAAWTDGERRDLHADMAALTLRIAGQALLGVDLAAQAPRVRAGLDAALAEFAAVTGLGPGGFGMARAGRNRGTGGASDQGAAGALARAAVHQLVDDIIGQRRAAPLGGPRRRRVRPARRGGAARRPQPPRGARSRDHPAAGRPRDHGKRADLDPVSAQPPPLGTAAGAGRS